MTTIPGRSRVVVPDAKIDLQSTSYQSFAQHKQQWAVKDCYENPGPVQFHGPTAHRSTETLQLESFAYLHEVSGLYTALQHITEQCRPGCSSAVLQAATSSLGSLTQVLDLLVSEAEGGSKRNRSDR